MTTEEFNEKYKEYLAEGHYGLALEKPEAIKYLDKCFQEFIKIPDFRFYQIKQKYNTFRFYEDGLTAKQTLEVEIQLKKIYEL